MSGVSERAVRALAIVGGGALLSAMGIDVLAVIGRHSGFPLLGSIELVQAAVAVSAAAGLIVATIAGAHATVHILVHRLSGMPRVALDRLSWLLSALFFALVAGGSAWIALDMIGAHEESELLGIPYAPVRIVLILGTGATAAIFLWHVLRGRAQ